MAILKVTSSNIKKFEYDEKKMILSITYGGKKGDSIYDYLNFPPTLWDQLVAFKGSYGSYVRTLVKGFEYKKRK